MLLLHLAVTADKLHSRTDTGFDPDPCIDTALLFSSLSVLLAERELAYETFIPLLHLRPFICSTLETNQKQGLGMGLISTNCLPG